MKVKTFPWSLFTGIASIEESDFPLEVPQNHHYVFFVTHSLLCGFDCRPAQVRVVICTENFPVHKNCRPHRNFRGLCQPHSAQALLSKAGVRKRSQLVRLAHEGSLGDVNGVETAVEWTANYGSPRISRGREIAGCLPVPAESTDYRNLLIF